MIMQIKQWGNSAAIRLPATLLQSMQLSVDSVVEVHEKNGKLILSPVKTEYRLADLLEGITAHNHHAEVSFGEPVGKEEF